MPVLRKDGPYIWVTWLNKLITGDQSCEWAYWFRTQFDSNSQLEHSTCCRRSNSRWEGGLLVHPSPPGHCLPFPSVSHN